MRGRKLVSLVRQHYTTSNTKQRTSSSIPTHTGLRGGDLSIISSPAPRYYSSSASTVGRQPSSLAMTVSNTPILNCTPSSSSSSTITITPSLSPSHRLQNPTYTIPPLLREPLETAARYIQSGQTVAFPTETVYGLGACTLDPSSTQKIYTIKNRPADNPLIVHVSSLDMLSRLLPPAYSLSALYLALVDAFWPGPLTLLFPSPTPPPLPAPQTIGIRMPNHPLALALIHTADTPISAPSANSSGRPSPTKAIHVYADLNGSKDLGCILDGGDCGVGVESTVVDGLGWKQGGEGVVDVLRPGGLGVEEIERVVREVDGGEERTRILVHGKPWSRNAVASSSGTQPNGKLEDAKESASSIKSTQTSEETAQKGIYNGRGPISKLAQQDLPPSTPGMKYRHYSPKIPVYLILPSTTFPRPRQAEQRCTKQAPGLDEAESEDYTPSRVIQRILHKSQIDTLKDIRPKLGLLHYQDSPLSRCLLTPSDSASPPVDIVLISLGPNAESAAQRLFSGILALEGNHSVDAILIEGCSDEGLGLAVMERVGKAVGGGGKNGELGNGQGVGDGRYWVQV